MRAQRSAAEPAPIFRVSIFDMSEESHAEYFAAREQIERDMGSRATDERVAAAHAEMAERYEALALVFGAKPAASAPAS